MRVEYPKLKVEISEKKTKKKTGSGVEKEYKYYMICKTVPRSMAEEMPYKLLVDPEHEWYCLPVETVYVFEQVVSMAAEDLKSKSVSINVRESRALSEMMEKISIVAPVIVASILAGSDVDILSDYIALGINPGFNVEEAKSELEQARQELVEALKSNPLTRNLQAIGQSTEVGNVLVAVSQLDGFFVKTYFTVEINNDKIVVAPTMIRITDFLGIVNFLTITIDREKAAAARD